MYAFMLQLTYLKVISTTVLSKIFEIVFVKSAQLVHHPAGGPGDLDVSIKNGEDVPVIHKYSGLCIMQLYIMHTLITYYHY